MYAFEETIISIGTMNKALTAWSLAGNDSGNNFKAEPVNGFTCSARLATGCSALIGELNLLALRKRQPIVTIDSLNYIIDLAGLIMKRFAPYYHQSSIAILWEIYMNGNKLTGSKCLQVFRHYKLIAINISASCRPKWNNITWQFYQLSQSLSNLHELRRANTLINEKGNDSSRNFLKRALEWIPVPMHCPFLRKSK